MDTHPHEVLFQSETRARVGGRLGNRTSPGFETGTLCSTVTMKTRLFRGTVTVFAAIMVVSQYAVMSRKKYHLLVGESSADSPQCSVSGILRSESVQSQQPIKHYVLCSQLRFALISCSPASRYIKQTHPNSNASPSNMIPATQDLVTYVYQVLVGQVRPRLCSSGFKLLTGRLKYISSMSQIVIR